MQGRLLFQAAIADIVEVEAAWGVSEGSGRSRLFSDASREWRVGDNVTADVSGTGNLAGSKTGVSGGCS